MRIADDPGDAFERGDFFRSALGVTAGDNNARAGIGAMDLPDGIAGLRIGRSRDRAGVQHHDIGSGVIVEHLRARSARKRAAQRSSVCFRGAAAKIFEGKRSHRMEFKAGQESLE